MTAICPEFCPFWRNRVVENVAISATLKRFFRNGGLAKNSKQRQWLAVFGSAKLSDVQEVPISPGSHEKKYETGPKRT